MVIFFPADGNKEFCLNRDHLHKYRFLYSLCTVLTNGRMAVTANGPFQQTYTFTTKQNKLSKYKVEHLSKM